MYHYSLRVSVSCTSKPGPQSVLFCAPQYPRLVPGRQSRGTKHTKVKHQTYQMIYLGVQNSKIRLPKYEEFYISEKIQIL